MRSNPNQIINTPQIGISSSAVDKKTIAPVVSPTRDRVLKVFGSPESNRRFRSVLAEHERMIARLKIRLR